MASRSLGRNGRCLFSMTQSLPKRAHADRSMLSSRSAAARTVLRHHVKYMSSAPAATATPPPESAKRVGGQFPWREAPSKPLSVMNILQRLLCKAALTTVLGRSDDPNWSDHYVDYEVPLGCQAALAQVTAAIFKLPPSEMLIIGAEYEAQSSAATGNNAHAQAQEEGAAGFSETNAAAAAQPAKEQADIGKHSGLSEAQAGADSDAAKSPNAVSEEKKGASANKQKAEAAAPLDEEVAGPAGGSDAAAAKATGAGAAAGGSAASGSGSAGMPEPSDMMDGRLVDFFDSALASAGSGGQSVSYRLVGIDKVNLVGLELLFGAVRGDDLSGSHKVKKTAVSVIHKPEARNSAPDGPTYLQQLMLGPAVLQVEADIDCRETFCVRDAASGEILQGSDAIYPCRHRLRLETVLRRSNPSPEEDYLPDFEWKVIDLDEWLDGNNFI